MTIDPAIRPAVRPVALVTGGARRVGNKIAQHLAEAGYDIALTHLNTPADLQPLIDAGAKAIAIRVDLTDQPAATQQVFDEFTGHFNRLDVLVNNASVYQPATLAKTDTEMIRRLNAIHIEAPLMLCQKYHPLLRASGGCVINMVDLLAERPWPEYLAYCASKAALWNLTLALARAMAPEVRVNGIAPGVVQWPMDHSEADKDRYLQRVPLGRAGSPEDVARLVHFLATASYITGQIIRLDGGRSIT